MATKALSFDVGDYVVYPKHGVGRVIELQSTDIAGMALALGVLAHARRGLGLAQAGGALVEQRLQRQHAFAGQAQFLGARGGVQRRGDQRFAHHRGLPGVDRQGHIQAAQRVQHRQIALSGDAEGGVDTVGQQRIDEDASGLLTDEEAPEYREALLAKYVEAGWLGKKSGRGFYDYRQK